ncbi:hypothetical protein K3740_08665 [Ruegeria conchae]|uniref:hypothetical protein n=1 Tax=Ruegeria conchae TaxID=981384 RepID=UPI0021A71B53|nr:hypothetical protein [Ruegeria conchae]UWR04732.1 hypothetical protein K3740_08665 [Ruegeria conchae]
MTKPENETATLEVAPLPRHAVPFGDLLASINLPETTYNKEAKKHGGCRTFKIGRRKYALLADWHKWLERRADLAGAA